MVFLTLVVNVHLAVIYPSYSILFIYKKIVGEWINCQAGMSFLYVMSNLISGTEIITRNSNWKMLNWEARASHQNYLMFILFALHVTCHSCFSCIQYQFKESQSWT